MMRRLFHSLPAPVRRALRSWRVRRDAGADGSAGRAAAPTPADPASAALAEISVPAHHAVWSDVTEARPSYVYKLHESRRRNRLVRAMGSAHPMWAVNSKAQGYRFAASLGIEHPRTIATFDDLSALDPSLLGARFLIKPQQGSTNRGVFGLVAAPDGGYRDLLSGRALSWDRVHREYRSHVNDGAISAAGMVEELLASSDGSGAIPDDWKVYVFGGRAVVTMQRRMNATADRSKWRFRIWTREWNDLGPVKFVDRLDDTLPAPVHAAEIIDAADRMGDALDLAFVRLDFYDTDRGVVFGEVSPHPGPPEVWHPAVDEMLGRHWERAEAATAVADIAGGRWADLERHR
ncbi:MAG: ATP-grasp fold amidoligase family protein [Acidimicrobiales bacterium]